MKIKTLDRSDWPRILEREQTYMPIVRAGLKGFASLIAMRRLTASLAVPVLDERVIIADVDYTWLQIAPEDENWWLTVMFDAEERAVQYYFDISLGNHIDAERSWFTDLYLDVVLLPDGRTALLDEEELDDALVRGEITAEEHALAVRTADVLMRLVPQERKRLEAFCDEIRKALACTLRDSRNIDGKF